MAISGSGTEQDPYIVDNWVDLKTCAANNVWVELNADINLLDNYPTGNVPQLNVYGSKIDGKGHSILNCYHTINEPMIRSSSADGYIKNLNFGNIYHTTSSAFINPNTTDNYLFQNCKIWGITVGGFTEKSGNSSVYKTFYGCSICIKCLNNWFTNNAKYESCNVYVDLTLSNYQHLVEYHWQYNFVSCYLEVHNIARLANNDEWAFSGSNCVLNFYQSSGINVANLRQESGLISILNKTNAPSLTATQYLKNVTQENWLNPIYLNSIGFNINPV